MSLTNKAAIITAFIALFAFIDARADEPAPAAIATAPTPITQTYVPRPGDVVEVGKDGALTKIDINKFFVLGVEWLPVSQLAHGVEIGLRQDGVVIWRRK